MLKRSALPKLALFVFVILAMGRILDPIAFAQADLRSVPLPSSTPSHRHLPIPRDGSQDLMRQFQMMQHLQELVKRQDPAAVESKASTIPALDADLLKSLSELLSPDQKAMFDSFKEQLGDLSQLDAQDAQRLQEGLGEVLRQPKADAMQARMEELLRKFHRERQVPPMQSGERSTSPRSPDGRSTETSDSNAVDETASSQMRPIDGPLAGSNRPESSQPSADKLASRIAEYFRNRGKPPGASEQQARAAAEFPVQPTQRSNPSGSQAPLSREGRPLPNPGSETARPTDNKQAQEPRQPSNGPAGMQKSEPALQTQSNPSALDTAELPSIPELLKRVNEDPGSLPPFSFPENSLDMDDIKKLLAERFPKKSKDDDWLSSLKSQLPNSLKAELHKTGLKDSLTDIMEELKNGTAQDGNAASPRSPNLNNLGRESSGPSLGSIQEELEELSNSLSKGDEQPAGSPKNSGKDSKTPSAAEKEEEAKGLLASISGMYDRWMNGSPDTEETEPNVSADEAPDTAQSSPWRWSIGYEGLLAIAICLGALFFGYLFVGRRQRREAKELQAKVFKSLSVSSRADLVEAFHLMVATTGAPIESWWTHRRAARAVSEMKPSAESSLEFLNKLYEKARYGPADFQFSEDEYQQARHALEQITAC